MDATLTSPLRRVVITGLGVVAPNGIGKEPFWQSCLTGRSGLRRITRFDANLLPSQVAGEVDDFDPLQLGLTSDEITSMDRATQFALAAANLALEDAQVGGALTSTIRERMGVMMGLALACVEEGERQWVRMTDQGARPPRLVTQEALPASLMMSHAAASSIAAHHHLHGPCLAIATGCSAGADAIGQAFWAIQEQQADLMLAGGTDSAISYAVLDVFCVMGALSTRYNDTPTRASRPYDYGRDGFVMAEGAGVLLLEAREHALERGAHIYAEILTFASNSNAYHMTSLPASGQPLQRLLRQTMAEGQVTPQEIDYINAHGSSTQPNERAETAAYKAVLGEHAARIPISATKSMLGHSQGAASAIETIVTALVLDQQVIPPTINQEVPDPECDLDYVPNSSRPANVRLALTHSSGFGGVNSALLLGRADWDGWHE
ncbi:beta-ketoacyl-[acyl-carrier-protein] synthase family protein [Dictyobacter formicarum]|uniref:Beta-ketoacyl-[acyl-carrier-protein] synthase II n=1 Tax=Dictyobacter formicarum TaxID=2778368 RepID=A0ABQ3VBY0_9CHLR|nr:beta-ketoacyl-[acyl-carrier-protein] synthase family protein [Dictyobacter formicarum]GHO83470.1 beta-ketoacyl-[acyl-carrier-protein] synthase II [Dictyobacter formicarum]